MDTLNHLLNNYDDLVTRIDTHIHRVTERFESAVMCKKGCDACCKFLTLFPVEAFALSRAYDTLTRPAQARVQDEIDRNGEKCPLLIGHACMLYSARPIICRTHGLPLYMEKDGEVMVDFCPDNFRGVEALPNDALLDLDQLNTTITAVNQHFIAHINTVLPDRIPVSEALSLCRLLDA